MMNEAQVMFHIILLAMCWIIASIWMGHDTLVDHGQGYLPPPPAAVRIGVVSLLLGLLLFTALTAAYWITRWVFV